VRQERHDGRLSFLLLLLLAALVSATAATADSPAIEQQTLHRSIPNFITCPGFTVAGEFDVNRTVFTFYDSDGNAVRQVTHVHFVGTLTNTTTGKSIPDEGNQVVTTDLLTGTTTTDARVRVDTVPGEGAILFQVGRVVRDAAGNVIFFAGQNDFLTRDFAEFCTYMAAP
jgi:hypothetical protein